MLSKMRYKNLLYYVRSDLKKNPNKLVDLNLTKKDEIELIIKKISFSKVNLKSLTIAIKWNTVNSWTRINLA
jgi:hypothetical protein